MRRRSKKGTVQNDRRIPSSMPTIAPPATKCFMRLHRLVLTRVVVLLFFCGFVITYMNNSSSRARSSLEAEGEDVVVVREAVSFRSRSRKKEKPSHARRHGPKRASKRKRNHRVHAASKPDPYHGSYRPVPESVTTCDGFDHGDRTPTTDVPPPPSVFSCGSSLGKCVWYRPAKFFHPRCGVGKDHEILLRELDGRHRSRTLWKRMPPILLPSVSLHPSLPRNGTRESPFPRHNLTLAHVHKTGGTSLLVAVGKLADRGAETTWNLVYDPNASPTAADEVWNGSSAFLDGAVGYRTEYGAEEHTVFAVVRDPAERFVSAIGQATHGRGSARNGVGRSLREECGGRDTSKEALRCFVDLVRRNGTWIELHFAPMAVEISFATTYADVPVAVFPFGEVPSLLYELDADPGEKRKDGKERAFRREGVLANLSVADYDDDVLGTLCGIYAVDVLLLRHLGMPNRCDRFS